MTNDWHVPFSAFREGLDEAAQPFFTGIRKGTMSVELFEPKGEDTQQPHAQDELYIVRQGSAVFTKDGENIDVGAGDVIFVEAGIDHRFIRLSADFSTWVIFWGPTGGESS